MTDYVGKRLGNYQLIRLLGEGGFAEVYLGEHVYLGTQAAIKLMRTQLSSEDMQSFRTEARTIANLLHPNIVRVLEFGVEDKTPFLVLDYAPNGTLRQRHPRGTAVPLTTIVPYVKQMAGALQRSHDEKLIHRDVKPENMLIGRQNEILLSDFGLALMVQSTRLQEVAGTIAYTAPEQIQGNPLPASDQYALGIAVYEWLSGDRPFQGSFNEVVSQHLAVPPAPLRDRLTTILPAVEEVVMRTLAKDPRDRFASVRDFAAALEQASQVDSDATIVARSPVTIELTIEQTVRAETPASPQVAPVSLKPPPAQPGPTLRSVGTTPTLYTYRGHSSKVNAVTWSPDGRYFASGSDDQTVHVWDATTGNQAGIYRGHSGSVNAVKYVPGEVHIASGSADKTVQVWAAATGNPLITYRGHANSVKAVACSPGGQYIASSSDNEDVQVWTVNTGSYIFIYRGHIYSINCVAWSPDGKRIASAGSGKVVQIWDAVDGRYIFSYSGHSASVNALAWSPDSKLIASGSDDKTVHVWDVVTGYNIVTARGHASAVTAVDWSADGSGIASAGTDGSVQVWDTGSGRKVNSYRYSAPVRSVAWSPDSRRIAFGSDDAAVLVWVVF